jgi:hypothetical protein
LASWAVASAKKELALRLLRLELLAPLPELEEEEEGGSFTMGSWVCKQQASH